MDSVRFGIIGLGNMGGGHLSYLPGVAQAKVTALCDIDPEKLARHANTQYKCFERYEDLLSSGLVDAIIIATPHYDHAPIAIAALDQGLHVLCEKPATVSVAQARKMNQAAERNPKQRFGIMFQARSSPMYRKLRELLADGELGEISRITWIATDWFRTWAYYASGGWRATWAGEGGGVLINQCPHNLDMIQWVTGMRPRRVTAVASIGKTHPIEVEDQASAILEYPGGAIGHFITTTGEAPVTNRLEIAGDRGKIVVENGKILFSRTRKSVRAIRETSRESFAVVETWPTEIPFAGAGESHKVITENFIASIMNDQPLIAPGTDGLAALELGNAILMSGLTGKAVDIPVDGEAFERFLQQMQRDHGGKKSLATDTGATVDMEASFRH